MNVARVCVSKKIREAQKCVQKTNLLVYEKQRGEGAEKLKPNKFVSQVRCVPGKKIRICTGAELKKACPPKPCPCPCPPKQRASIMSWIAAMIGLGFKVLIAGGIVYWTVERGVWGTPDSTEALYANLCRSYGSRFCTENTEPKEIKKNRLCDAQQSIQCQKITPPPGTCESAPSIERQAHTVKENWNRLVIFTFGLLANFPDNAVRFYHSSKNNINNVVNPKDPCE